MTKPLDALTPVEVCVAAAIAELRRQADEGASIYFRESDGMIDGRVNLRKLVQVILKAQP